MRVPAAPLRGAPTARSLSAASAVSLAPAAAAVLGAVFVLIGGGLRLVGIALLLAYAAALVVSGIHAAVRFHSVVVGASPAIRGNRHPGDVSMRVRARAHGARGSSASFVSSPPSRVSQSKPPRIGQSGGAALSPALGRGKRARDRLGDRRRVVGDDFRAGLTLELARVRGNVRHDDREPRGRVRLQLSRICVASEAALVRSIRRDGDGRRPRAAARRRGDPGRTRGNERRRRVGASRRAHVARARAGRRRSLRQSDVSPRLFSSASASRSTSTPWRSTRCPRKTTCAALDAVGRRRGNAVEPCSHRHDVGGDALRPEAVTAVACVPRRLRELDTCVRACAAKPVEAVVGARRHGAVSEPVGHEVDRPEDDGP